MRGPDACSICRRAFPNDDEAEEHRARYPNCLVINRGTRANVPASEPPVANQPETSQTTRVGTRIRTAAAIITPVVNPPGGNPPGGNAPPGGNNVPRDGQPRNPDTLGRPKEGPRAEHAGEVAAAAPIEIEGYSLNYITIPPNFFEMLETEIVPRGERSPAITNFARTITHNQNYRMKKLKGLLALLTAISLDGSYLFIRLCSILSLLFAFANCCLGFYTPDVNYFIVRITERNSF
ncbi:hypothetical protein HPULCUR_006810 [Helicostylum pulchrum]|uniref:Uncharacterized protein n=1 Tax=Helicostylum pulchrum TaxID=562976 RepID=A0ABP9Y2X6_9FUNG